jgi:hypothetical protein
MTLTETVRTNESPIIPNEIKQRTVPINNGADTYELIPAVDGKQIQILTFVLSVNVAGSYTLQSGSDEIMPFPMVTTGGVFRHSENKDRPLFCGNVGENMNLVTTASPSAGGCYVQWREK